MGEGRSGYETAANNGVSHFIEHLIFGATARRESGQLDLEAESLGADAECPYIQSSGTFQHNSKLKVYRQGN